MRRKMVRFAEEMGQREADIKGGIAEMDDLKVEKDELVVVDEHILGAVIAVNQGMAAGSRIFDQLLKERAGGGNPGRREAVIWLQAQLLEEAPVGELMIKFRILFGRIVDLREQSPE